MSAHSLALLVHASAPLRARVRSMLEQEGFAVIEADCGRKAVALAAQHRIGLLVAGTMLPDVHGITLFDKLAAGRNGLYAVCLPETEERPEPPSALPESRGLTPLPQAVFARGQSSLSRLSTTPTTHLTPAQRAPAAAGVLPAKPCGEARER